MAFDDPGDAAAHCELGFGQGVSVNIHAAANPGQYVATDFNPAHTAHARHLAAKSGADLRLYDDSFAQLLSRDDIPAFDSISLHGVWSWVSQDNRRIITDLAARHLKPGGVFYVSYNCHPGWSSAQPLRQILALHNQYGPESSSAAQCVAPALKFAETLLAAGPLYARINPGLADRLQTIKNQPADYLAHEYLNREWHCAWFTDTAEGLANAKLDFATTAEPLDVLDSINLTPEGITFLNAIEHPTLRQQMRDYFVNKQFRKDIYLRGARLLSPSEQRARALATRIVLERPVDAIPMKLNGAQGEAILNDATFRPLVEALAARDGAPKSFEDLARALPTVGLGELLTACAVLVGAGHAAPCHPDSVARQVRPRCDALNRHLLQRAQTRSDINTLASPVTGGGIAVNRFQQLFLLARDHGHTTPAEWARSTWQRLAADGQAVLKDGLPLTSPEDNVAELTAQANMFAEKTLPILKALQVV